MFGTHTSYRLCMLGIIALIVFLALAAIGPSYAIAADPTPPASTTQPSTDQSDDGNKTTSSITNQQIVLILIVAVSAVIFFGIFITSIENVQRRAYDTLERLNLAGVPASAEVIRELSFTRDAASPSEMLGAREAKGRSSIPPYKFSVRVPETILIGSEAIISVELLDLPNGQVTWSAKEDDPIMVTQHGNNAVVKGSKEGLFILAATVKDNEGEITKEHVAIQISKPVEGKKPVSIPILGAGSATLAIVLFIIIMLIAFGTANVLTGEQLTPIITTLIGGFVGAAGAVAATSKDKEQAESPAK